MSELYLEKINAGRNMQPKNDYIDYYLSKINKIFNLKIIINIKLLLKNMYLLNI